MRPASLPFCLLIGAVAVMLNTMAAPAAQAAIDVTDALNRPALAPARPEKVPMIGLARADRRLVAVGVRGIVLYSDDGGANWQQARTPVNVTLTAVRFANARQGWAIGHLGVVLRTEDGGATWRRQLDGVTAAGIVLQQAEAAAAAAPGDTAVQERLSQARMLVRDGADKPFLDLLVDDAQRALAVGAYGLALRTDDGGRSWQAWDARIANPKGLHLYRVMRAGSDAFIVGEQGLLLRGGGDLERFAAIDSPYNGSWFGLLPLSPERLLLYGLRGRAFRSDDGGARWTQLPSNGEPAFNCAIVLTDGRIVVGDQAGRLLVGANDAQGFSPVPMLRLSPISDIVQAADGNLVVAGAVGVQVVKLSTLNGAAATRAGKPQ